MTNTPPRPMTLPPRNRIFMECAGMLTDTGELAPLTESDLEHLRWIEEEKIRRAVRKELESDRSRTTTDRHS